MRLTIIVSRQRTGSTGLTTALGKLNNIVSFGEIFHHAAFEEHEGTVEALYINREAMFLPFRVDLFRENPTLSAPTIEHQQQVFELYIQHLTGLTDCKHIVLDIKYNSWHHLNLIYNKFWDFPFLYHLLKRRNSVFIHVKRRNKFLRHLSEQLSLNSHIWHNQSDTPDNASRVLEIDPKLAFKDMAETKRLETHFDNMLKTVRLTETLYYEDMYHGQGFTKNTTEKLQRFFSTNKMTNLKTSLVKINKKPKKTIQNAEELRRFFKDTPYWENVRDALAETGP